MNKSSSTLLFRLAKLSLILVSLLFAEGLLQISSTWVRKIDRITAHPYLRQIAIDDARLGVRGNPSHPDHDKLGFRNPKKPGTAHIVAMGDSQTYGNNVSTYEAWPRILSTRLNKGIYNMGMGGYGPYHNFLNLELALSLKPKWIIFGFYFGNDFYDSFALALRNNTLKDFIPQVRIEKIKRLEIAGPLKKKTSVLFEGTLVPESQANTNNVNLLTQARTWISYNSRLYGLARTLRTELTSRPKTLLLSKDFDVIVRELSERNLKFASVFNGQHWKTILTSPYRGQVLDDSDMRIRAGIDISKLSIKKMKDQIQATGNAKFLVLLIPTKESVFWPKVKNPENHKGLQALIENENRLRSELIEYFKSENILFLDVLPHLRNAKIQPYFQNADGHPNFEGHRIIAEKIEEMVRRN